MARHSQRYYDAYAVAAHVFTALVEAGFIHSGDPEKTISELDDDEAAARCVDACHIIATTIEQERKRL